MNGHCVQWMAGNGDCGVRRLLLHLGDDRVGCVAFFHLTFPFRALTRGRSAGFRLIALIPLLLLVSACSGDLSTLAPAGPASRKVALLWWVMLGGACAIFMLIAVLLALVFFSPASLARVKTHHWLIGGGIGFPIPILTALVAFSFMQGESLLPQSGSDPLRIYAVSRMWKWEFAYETPTGEVRISDVMHMPVGRDVIVEVTSDDVIHSFWVPRLGGKIDAIPGLSNKIALRADQTGTFGGICAEYCGTGHAGMSFRVVAHTESEFSKVIGGLGQR
ncbi:MAG: cytochrome c oxidase subunit II [Rhizobium sp.]|nr:MAG: cytochrome c oxidase subunit II [Rhizobium sp.]